MACLQLVFVLVISSLLGTTWGQDTCNNLGVIGGHKIHIKDAPYIVGILEDGDLVCGGSIVHEQFILTSASCVSDETFRYVLVGTARLYKGGELFAIEENLCHENYDPENGENDICLLKINRPVQLGRRVAIVQLADSYFDVPNGALANVTGWGSTDNAGKKYPRHLHQTMVPVVSQECCRELNPDMTDTMLCAGSKGHDSCEGDAGGPLTYNNVQIGVVSFGDDDGCGVNPGFYTKVSEFKTWITETIANNS